MNTPFLSCLFVLFLFCGGLSSCQNNNDEFYTTNKLTAADIFVASEAYQNFHKTLRKDEKKMRTILSKLTEVEKIKYQGLLEQLIKSTNTIEFDETIAVLNELLGFDYQKRLENLASMTIDLFRSHNFTTLELLRAQQRYNAFQSSIPTTRSNSEQLAYCRNECENAFAASVNSCPNTKDPWERDFNYDDYIAYRDCYMLKDIERFNCYNRC